MHRSLLGSSSAGRAPAGTTLAASHSAPAGADRAPRPAASRGNRGMAGVLDGEQPGDGSAGLDTGPIDRRHLSGLQPAFRAKVERVLRRLQAEGWQPFVAEGLRTRAQQREKVRRGYSRTMNSRHLSGRAADIVDRRWGWGGPAKDDDHPFWRALGRAAAAEGLTWGGNWRSFKDVAHLQQ